MVTNFFRINIPFEKFQIQRVAYSNEKLAALRQEHNKDASFFRNGDSIYISPRKGFGLELGKLTDVKIDEAPGVALSLIRHLIFRAFRDAFPERVPESFSPLRFFSAKPEHDAVKNFLPEEFHGQISYPNGRSGGKTNNGGRETVFRAPHPKSSTLAIQRRSSQPSQRGI